MDIVERLSQRLGAASTLLKKRTCCAPSVCAWEAAQADYGSSSSYEGSHELYCVGEAEGDGDKVLLCIAMFARN